MNMSPSRLFHVTQFVRYDRMCLTHKEVDGKIDFVYVRAMNLKGQQIKWVTNKRYKNPVNRANHF